MLCFVWKGGRRILKRIINCWGVSWRVIFVSSQNKNTVFLVILFFSMGDFLGKSVLRGSYILKSNPVNWDIFAFYFTAWQISKTCSPIHDSKLQRCFSLFSNLKEIKWNDLCSKTIREVRHASSGFLCFFEVKCCRTLCPHLDLTWLA